MEKWIVTGISGSGRVELLDGVRQEAESRGRRVSVHDVGELIKREAIAHGIPIVDERFLDMDNSQLRLLRASALKEVELRILKQPEVDLHLIGIHATFRWKGRLIPGISYPDILRLAPDGFITVAHDVQEVMDTNRRNPKWDEYTLPTLQETQEWMMVEEFTTEVMAEVLSRPIFLVCRNHRIPNLTDLLLSDKKRIYLSYPITAVQETQPELLEEIQGPILGKLEDLFVVFNPLAIEDMPLASPRAKEGLLEFVEQLTPQAVELIKARTIERDFQFIDQSDAIVVFYMTDKLSSGVLAEIYYAKRNQTPVFMVYSGKKSPFIEDAVTVIESDIASLLSRLEEFAKNRHKNLQQPGGQVMIGEGIAPLTATPEVE